MSVPPQDRPPGGSSYGPGAAGPLRPEQERTLAIVSHIGSLVAAWLALGLLCPLIVWLLYRDRSDYVRRHALESLNFQITLLVYLAVSVVIGILTFGLALFVLLPLLAVFGLVFIIIATIAASNGQDYRYPLTLRFVH